MNGEPGAVTKPKLAYNLDEAAEATGYSVRTLRIAIRRHDLLARYANSKPIILGDELLDWLKSLPTEPKNGHQPLSHLADDDPIAEPWPGAPSAPSAQPTETVIALYRTPEEVAPELGISKSTLRSYCRASGIHTRLGKRMMLHKDDIEPLVQWIQEHRAKKGEWWNEPGRDPFA